MSSGMLQDMSEQKVKEVGQISLHFPLLTSVNHTFNYLRIIIKIHIYHTTCTHVNKTNQTKQDRNSPPKKTTKITSSQHRTEIGNSHKTPPLVPSKLQQKFTMNIVQPKFCPNFPNYRLYLEIIMMLSFSMKNTVVG